MNGGPLDEFGLTIKQRKFCLAYVGQANGNGTEACRIAGYDGNDDTLKSQACENLTKPYIAEAIEQLIAESEASLSMKVMDAAEVKAHLSNLARTAERDSDKIRAAELMAKINGQLITKYELSNDDLRDMIARASSQFPAQIPLPPTFGSQDDDAPAS